MEDLQYYLTHSYSNDNNYVIAEVYTHLQNQIENIEALSKKYPINFKYLTAAAIYVSKLIEDNPSIAHKIHKIKIQENGNDN